MLEIEQATANVEAQARLSEMRAQLGIGPATPLDGPPRRRPPGSRPRPSTPA